MTNSREVFVIDDDEAMRHSLGFLLRSSGIGSKIFDSAQAFLNIASTQPPSCVITDVRMPGMDGIELVRRLADIKPRHNVIVMTGHGDVGLAVEAMKAGARDFIEKPFSDETMLSAVRDCLSFESRSLVDAEARDRYAAEFSTLSPREREVVQHVVAGKTSKVIAIELGISPRTVEVYRASMMLKTKAKSLSELVRMALSAEL
jgi:two-component system, LuxR family, response regulator FixJ